MNKAEYDNYVNYSKTVEAIVERIKPIMAGQPPLVVGAVLGDLTAIWLAGHYAETKAATDKMRAYLMTMQAAHVLGLVAEMDAP